MCGDLGKSITSCKTSIFCYFVINKVLFLLNILLFSIVFSTVRLLDKGPDVIQTNWIYVYLILLRKKKKKKKKKKGRGVLLQKKCLFLKRFFSCYQQSYMFF